jgi:tetratricopeptide (TPR) repeat protein
MAYEPVAAYAEPWPTKARRWLGRHRILATSTAAVVVAATLILSAATTLLQAANGREQSSRAKAEANFKLARDAVDRYFTKVSENPRLKAHDLEKLRKDLLQQARDFYEQFIREQGASPEVQIGLWVAYDRLGKISVEMGSREEALRSFEHAQRIAEHVLRQRQGDVESQRALASSLHNQAWIYTLEVKMDQARAHFVRALEISRRVVAQDAKEPRNLDELARVLMDLGVHCQQTGRFADARAAFSEALPIREQLALEHAETPAFRQSWVRAYYVLGRLERTVAADFAAALRYFERARAVGEELAKKHPDEPDYQAELGNVLCELGATQYGLHDAVRARAALQEALSFWARLSEQHPDNPGYEESRVTSLNDLGVLCRKTGEFAQASKFLDEALPSAKRLAQRLGTDPELHRIVAMVLNNLGELQFVTGRPDSARASFEEAAGICELLVRGHDHFLKFCAELNRARISLARARASHGDHEAALRGMEPSLGDPHLSGEDAYEVACAYALASSAAARDGHLASAERSRRTEQHAVRSMEWLERAFAGGYTDLDNLKQDKELDSLRARADFKKFVARLEAAPPRRQGASG